MTTKYLNFNFDFRLVCENINECASDPCENNAQCVDDVLDYRCLCSEQFEGKNRSKTKQNKMCRYS